MAIMLSIRETFFCFNAQILSTCKGIMTRKVNNLTYKKGVLHKLWLRPDGFDLLQPQRRDQRAAGCFKYQFQIGSIQDCSCRDDFA